MSPFATTMYPKFFQLSETAICIEWGNDIDQEINRQVLDLDYAMHQKPFPGFLESVPAYASLTVYYQMELMEAAHAEPFLYVKKHVKTLLHHKLEADSQPDRLVSIPVCYDEEFGLDLEFVAQEKGIKKEALIRLHQQNQYKVYMMGFLPGFAYMGKLDEALATGRKPSPRAKVEAGAVGIAGYQTGIYPVSAPGGWQIIGRTPFPMFDPKAKHPFLLKTGDAIQFNAITKAAYYEMLPKQDDVDIMPAESPADAILIKPGVYATIQDNGRYGYRAFGVPVGGAMDHLSHNTANALVGNTPNAATIECTMGGLVLQINKDTEIALAGAGTALINHIETAYNKRHAVNKNDILAIQFNNKGLRTYIAVSGGFASPELMNSKSMSPVIGIGAPLKPGAKLYFGKDHSDTSKEIDGGLIAAAESNPKRIRVMRGPEFKRLKPASAEVFSSQEFTLTNRCDRMGCHLQAPPLFLSDSREMLSTAVTKGTIQLTPNGQLILLMSDCQTTGGYPRVGQIAAVDLPRVAQLIPGESFRFEIISFAEAEALYLQQQQAIHDLFR